MSCVRTIFNEVANMLRYSIYIYYVCLIYMYASYIPCICTSYTLYTYSFFPGMSEKGLGHSGGGLPGHIRHHVTSAVRVVCVQCIYSMYLIYCIYGVHSRVYNIPYAHRSLIAHTILLHTTHSLYTAVLLYFTTCTLYIHIHAASAYLPVTLSRTLNTQYRCCQRWLTYCVSSTRGPLLGLRA